MSTPTREYTVYEQAYDYFNFALFLGQLPPCLITLQRKANTRGYYSPDRFVGRSCHGDYTDEIALNPDLFVGRSDKEILSTLVHEMTHLWQKHFGNSGRGRYHNREWAHRMLVLGLRPVSLDQPGRMTGQSVTHEIGPGGRFDLAAEQLLSSGFCLNWQSQMDLISQGTSLLRGKAPTTGGDKAISKVKYTCPSCELNAWAKPKAHLICGNCKKIMSMN
jgi:hypothetical protein